MAAAGLVHPVRRLVGVSPSCSLAAYKTSRRSHLLAGVLAPVMALSAGSIGTLMLIGIDHRTMAGTSHGSPSARCSRSWPSGAIAARLFVTVKAVGKHTNSIFTKLDLPHAADDNRRVLAVLAWLSDARSGRTTPGRGGRAAGRPGRSQATTRAWRVQGRGRCRTARDRRTLPTPPVHPPVRRVAQRRLTVAG